MLEPKWFEYIRKRRWVYFLAISSSEATSSGCYTRYGLSVFFFSEILSLISSRMNEFFLWKLVRAVGIYHWVLIAFESMELKQNVIVSWVKFEIFMSYLFRTMMVTFDSNVKVALESMSSNVMTKINYRGFVVLFRWRHCG